MRCLTAMAKENKDCNQASGHMLDQLSLRPLTCMEDLFGLPRASMGYVQAREIYEDLQSAIRDVCDEPRVPPIAYDILAWDGAHTKN